MKPLRSARSIALGAMGLALMALPVARAQDDTKSADTATKTPSADGSRTPFESIEALNAHYEQQMKDLDRKKLDDLAAFAAGASADAAESAYQDVFNLAVAREMYDAAEKPAEAYLERGQGDPYARGLATFINVIAQADRGEYDQSIKDLGSFLEARPGDVKLEPNTMYAVGESFLQRLIRSGRYDVARQVCELFSRDSVDNDVKQHFATRRERMSMLGQDAPAIAGVDVDGKPVSLADMKGKVVLIDFWATWCPPCVAEVPNLRSLTDRFGEKGFAILGVNLDSAHSEVGGTEKALPMVRRFLINYRIPWPNVINGADGKDFTKDYGVREIPASFLVGRDGKIVHVELSGESLERAVAQAVGEEETTASSTR